MKPDKCTTDYFPVNHAQLSASVKGKDPYYRIRRRPFWRTELSYGLALMVLVIVTVACWFVIWEVFG